MRAEVNDGKHWSSIRFYPETVKEVAGLLRTCKNAKKQPLHLSVYFNEDGTITATVGIDKRVPEKQANFITT